MATATMGLRRRVTVNNSPSPTSQQHPSASSSGSASATNGSNKRTRNENNNNPSHGNLNSMGGGTNRDEPPMKKSRAAGYGGSGKTRSNSPAVNENTLERGNNAHHVTSGKGRHAGGKSSSRTKSPSISTSAPMAMIATSTPTSSVSSIPTIPAISTSTNISSIPQHQPVQSDVPSSYGVLGSSAWPTSTGMQDPGAYTSITGLNMPGTVQAGLCAAAGLGLPTSIPYMATSMATFVGNATNLGKNSSVSYLDISNMTSGSINANSSGNLSAGYASKPGIPAHNGQDGKGAPLPFSGVVPTSGNSSISYGATSASQITQQTSGETAGPAVGKSFQNDSMFNAYQPWVIKTYGDLAKTKTITIKKYARILRTLKGEEVNSAENSKFRFWVKSKGFHIGQPSGYDAKPADRIVGRHAVTSPGLDPPLYVPTQLPHNKALNGAEGTVPPGRVYKKVAIVENFFDIIHAVHVDLEGRPGKHAGQKRTYRTITETYAFLPREAVTRFLLGCTECQRRPRTPSPSNLSNQSQASAVSTSATGSIAVTSATSTLRTSTTPTTTIPVPGTTVTTPLSPTPAATALSSSQPRRQSSPKPREASHPPESKSLFNYRHPKHQQRNCVTASRDKAEKERERETCERNEKEKEREAKYNPLSITNLLKKEPAGVQGTALAVTSNENSVESRRTPESDRASSRSSVSSKRRRMLPEGRTPSPSPTLPLPTPWSPGLDPKNTPIDYSLPITTAYLKHQQRILAEKAKTVEAAEFTFDNERDNEARDSSSPIDVEGGYDEDYTIERDRFSPAAGLIDTNLNLLATIQHLHCQVMLALTERLRPSVIPASLMLPPATVILPNMLMAPEFAISTSMPQRYS